MMNVISWPELLHVAQGSGIHRTLLNRNVHKIFAKEKLRAKNLQSLCQPYQLQFCSFEEMNKKCSQEAQETLLFRLPSDICQPSYEDFCKSLGKDINNIHYYRCNSKFFALVNVPQLEPPMGGQKGASRGLNTFPLRSRIFQPTFKANAFTFKPNFYNMVEERSEKTLLSEIKQLKTVTEQIDRLCFLLGMNEYECRLRFFLIAQLKDFICHGIFEGFELIPFGSSVNGLGTKWGDLDLTLVPKNQNIISLSNDFKPQSFLIENDRITTQRCISILAQIIRFLPDTHDVVNIPLARVPIVKFKSDLTQLDVDISVQFSREKGGWVAANILYDLNKYCPNFLKFSTVIRYWAKQQKLASKKPGDGFTGFMIISLVVAFLQTRKQPLLPPIKQLNLLPELELSENNFQPLEEYLKRSEEVSIEELLAEFFLHISRFDFSTQGFSLYQGKVVSNPSFNPIYIENVLERELNVTKNITKQTLEHFITKAEESYMICSGKLDLFDLLSFKTSIKKARKNNNVINMKNFFESNP